MTTKLSPGWKKINQGLLVSVTEMTDLLAEVEKYSTGFDMAEKAVAAQTGAMRKTLQQLRTDYTMVNNALVSVKAPKRKDAALKEEVATLQKELKDMFSEGTAIWDTTRSIQGQDPSKAAHNAEKALKDWNAAVSKVKNKTVKKIISKSKIASCLKTIAKQLVGVGKAKMLLMATNGARNRAKLQYKTKATAVAKSLRQTMSALKNLGGAVDKMGM